MTVLDPPPHVDARRQRLHAHVDLGSGVGLEIGPLESPTVTKPPWDVRYVDVLDTESLREHFRGDPNVSTDRIVDVDFALQCDGKLRSLAEAAAPAAPYQWAIASHVIEHVPDLVGWLADIASLVDDGAPLFLVVPDRHYTFDVARPPTTVGQILEAHSLGRTIPSERAVFDHYRSVVEISAAALWAGASPADAPRTFTLEQAAELRAQAQRGEYVDSHVWVFSPSEFVGQIADLGELDMVDFVIERVLPTMSGELEFNVVLRRLPREADAERRTALRRAALEALDLEGIEGPHAQPAKTTGASDLEGIEAPHAQPAKTMGVSDLEARLIETKREVMRRLRGLRRRLP